MLKKVVISILSFSSIFCSKANSEEIRNFDSKSDIRLGGVLRGAYPFYSGNNLINSIPSNIQVEIRGESYLFGVSGLLIDYSSVTRKLLPISTTTPLYASQVDINGSSFLAAISKSFLEVSLYSTPTYNPESQFEVGWTGGLISENVSFSQQFVQGENFGNIGFDLGFYSRYYGIYPFVPHGRALLSLANLYDHGTTYISYANNSQKYSSSWKVGYKGTIGLDYYITKDILISSNIILNNFEFINPFFARSSSIKQKAAEKTETTTTTTPTTPIIVPANDPIFNFDEQVNSINLGIGYLF